MFFQLNSIFKRGTVGRGRGFDNSITAELVGRGDHKFHVKGIYELILRRLDPELSTLYCTRLGLDQVILANAALSRSSYSVHEGKPWTRWTESEQSDVQNVN